MKDLGKLVGHDLRSILGILQISAEDLKLELDDTNLETCYEIIKQLSLDIKRCLEISSFLQSELKELV